jgi:ketosteroid isomerase-like protein
MTASSTAAAFDLAALRQGVEHRDVATMLRLYDDDAEIVITDRDHPPSAPKVMHGRAQIGMFLGDVMGRDMTHALDHVVASGDTVSFVQRCRYPDGSRVTFSSVLDIDDDGRIARQEAIQAWDAATGTDAQAAPRAEYKDFAEPDEVRRFSHGRMEVLHLAAGDVGRMVLEPGWRWSEHVKPIAGTELCETAHLGYQVSGVLRIQMADGTTMDARPGMAGSVPPGHDAWVVGEKPAVLIDWAGAASYAR